MQLFLDSDAVRWHLYLKDVADQKLRRMFKERWCSLTHTFQFRPLWAFMLLVFDYTSVQITLDESACAAALTLQWIFCFVLLFRHTFCSNKFHEWWRRWKSNSQLIFKNLAPKRCIVYSEHVSISVHFNDHIGTFFIVSQVGMYYFLPHCDNRNTKQSSDLRDRPCDKIYLFNFHRSFCMCFGKHCFIRSRPLEVYWVS